VIYRYQNLRYLDPSHPELLFLDLPFKWKTRYRFAGTDLNSGHYFSFGARGALSELRYYNRNPDDYALLAIEVDIDRVLDLTQPELIQKTLSIFEKTLNYTFTLYEKPVYPIKTQAATLLLAVFVDQIAAGGRFLDFVGAWAYRNEYIGIKYPGARAMTNEDRRDIARGLEYDPFIGGPNAQWNRYLGIEEDFFNRLHTSPAAQNLVIFSGHYLTTHIKRVDITVPSGEQYRRENDFGDMTEEELDRNYQKSHLPCTLEHQLQYKLRGDKLWLNFQKPEFIREVALEPLALDDGCT